MSLFPDVFGLLNVPAVQAFVGASRPRIYAHGSAPQAPASPYITWHTPDSVPENTLAETPAIDRASVQVDIWSNSEEAGAAREAERLALAVRDAIEAAHDIQQMFDGGQDASTMRFRFTIVFTYWLDRN